MFLNCDGEIIPQCLSDSESGDVIVSMLDQKAVILPVTCLAESSSQALGIYEDKVAGNLESLMVITKKESLHVN